MSTRSPIVRAITLTAAVALMAGASPAGRAPAALMPANAAQPTPQQVADALLAADRGYSTASARTDLVTGISAMFSDRIIMPLPNGSFAYTLAEAKAALQASPAYATARAEWVPIRVGVSADGQHGFTFGFMTVRQADGTTIPMKYMTYWVKEQGTWKAAAYKRRRAERAASTITMPPALPPRIVAPTANATVLSSLYRSVVATEQAFSDEAQRIGLGIAFQRMGSSDAVNMGPPNEPGFIVGADAIGRSVSGPSPLAQPSPVYWSADTAIVASSGDLAITFGVIRQHKPQSPSALGAPFFTIWHRPNTTAPWRYIAE